MNVNKLKEYVVQNKTKTAKISVIVIVLIAAVFVFFFQTGNVEPIPLKGDKTTASQSASKDENQAGHQGDSSVKDSSQKDSDTVVVDIDGQVVAPQVIELPKNSRISDAIYAAGGLTKKADVSTINRAKILTDGEKIYIPAKGEQTSVAGSGAGTAGKDTESAAGTGTAGNGVVNSGGSSANSKININTASASQLQQITGIGPATAEKIITYRQKTPFKSIEELKNVNGIGDKTFEKMKDQVTI